MSRVNADGLRPVTACFITFQHNRMGHEDQTAARAMAKADAGSAGWTAFQGVNRRGFGPARLFA